MQEIAKVDHVVLGPLLWEQRPAIITLLLLVLPCVCGSSAKA